MLDAAGAYERDLSDGLRDHERKILARWDAGEDPADIARATGCAPSTVASVIKFYDDRVPAVDREALARTNARFTAQLAAVMARANKAIAVDEIEAMLEDRIEALVAELLPNARRAGPEMRCGSLAGEAGQSLAVNVGSGSKRGWWKDFAGDDGGDALKLVAAVLFAGDIKKAIAWAKSWLGIDDGDPSRIEQHRIEARAQADRRAAAAEDERLGAVERARKRWLGGRVLVPGDPVTRYLAARGCDPALLPRLPGVLRYHPAVPYGWQGPEVPAMLAAVVNLAGEIVGVHRTWLDTARNAKAGPDLIGYERDGVPNDPKKVMGRYRDDGAHIPVWKGAHDCTLRDIPEGTDVYVSEGIEDGMTVACADPSLRVIAMISVSNWMGLDLPPQMGRLILLRQNDPAGSEAAKAIARGITHHRAKGRRVLVVPLPDDVKDINDLARGIKS